MVQLGGLEPPTSCSTDRRSNQLSYNCIAGPKNGCRTGRKLGATPRFGKAVRAREISTDNNKKPGLAPGPCVVSVSRDQAAVLKIFEAPALIGSAVSVAIL